MTGFTAASGNTLRLAIMGENRIGMHMLTLILCILSAVGGCTLGASVMACMAVAKEADRQAAMWQRGAGQR